MLLGFADLSTTAANAFSVYYTQNNIKIAYHEREDVAQLAGQREGIPQS